MDAHELIAFWGHDNLKRWPEADLRNRHLPEASRTFLLTVGLPGKETGWTLRFVTDNDRSPELSAPEQPDKAHYWRIGFDAQSSICLDEAREGCVVVIEADGQERFINSSVELFGECLALYQQYRTNPAILADDDPEAITAITEERMRNADSAAFENDEHYWPVILEQMKYGHL